MVAKDALISLDETSLGTVDVDPTVGGLRYCPERTMLLKDEAGRYIARRRTAPLACLSSSGAFLE